MTTYFSITNSWFELGVLSLVSSDDNSSFTKIDFRTLSCFPADSLIENS